VLTPIGDGNDILYGGGGNDDLDGEDGADTLFGGSGVNDPLYTYGDEIEWRLEFAGDPEHPTDPTDCYTISYRKSETETWNLDGIGWRDVASLSDSRAVYILQDWWDSNLLTFDGDTVTFRTKRSPDMIEMPVLFHRSRAVAYSNNVINCLVDGNRLVFADVKGPVAGGHDLFNWYVVQAANLVGFTGSIAASEERVYHNDFGSIHCGTNVLREIPWEYWWQNLQ